jgi:hypothetical protein
MKPALTRRGNRACDSIRGPSVATGASSTSSTTCTACGLDRLTTASSTSWRAGGWPNEAVSIGRRQRVCSAFLAAGQSAGVERHAGRLEGGHAHVDGDFAVVVFVEHQHTGADLRAQRVFVGQALLVDEAHEAARTVAAVFDLAAVGVEDPVAEIGVRHGGAFDQQDLVGAHAPVAIGQGAHTRRRQVDVLAHAVQDDEIVARAVHFGEVPDHGPIIAQKASCAAGEPRWLEGQARRLRRRRPPD